MQGADYFPSKVWPLHIQRMRQFLDQHDQLLLVLGDAGTGKSSLLKHFYDLGNQPGNCLELKGKSGLQPQKLTKLIAKKWHLELKLDQNFRQHQLDDILTAMQKFHQPGLLVIDDAHLLPIATLAALMHMCLSQETDQIVLRILLLGEPSLAQTLGNLHHPDILIPTIKLEPLNRDETKLFIEHVLDQIGFGKTRPLKEAQIDELFTQSQGIAEQARSLVMQHMRQHHPHKFDDNKSTAVIGSSVSHWIGQHWIKLASLGMLGVAFLGMHQYQLHMNRLNQMVLQQPTPSIEQKHSPLPALAHYTPQISSTIKVKQQAKPEKSTIVKMDADTQPLVKSLAATISPSKVAVQPKPKTVNIAVPTTATDKALKQPNLAAMTPPIVLKPVTLTPVTQKNVTTSAVTKDDKPTAINLHKANKPTKVAVNKPSTQRHFVLQIMGDYDQQRVIAMQNKLNNSDTQVRQSQRNDKTWYTLTYGDYPQYHVAKQAMATLPNNIKVLHPWIKPIKPNA